MVGNTRLTASGIALWYAFMFMAYCSGWPTEVTIPVSALCLRSKLSRSAVYKERNVLRNYGLIDFDTASGRRSTRYRIRSFEARLVATEMSATRTQTETGVIIPAEDTSEMSSVASTSRTQTGDERIKAGETSTTWPQPCIQTEDSTYISIKNKYRDKRGYGGKKERERKEPNETSCPQYSSPSYPQSQQLTANDIVDLFNDICTTYPTVDGITQYSTALSNSLMFDRYSKADYSTIFQKAEQSSNLKARTHDEESPVDFGWILEHSKEIKDGAFDN